LLPILAIDSTARAPAPIAAAERGRRLFAAKGCVTCHVRSDVDIAGELRDYGPNLSDRKFPADYLAKFLANPAMRPPIYGKGPMPNPQLRATEIASLIHYINSDKRIVAR
jgi:mono/diheme cytochrome c family protein